MNLFDELLRRARYLGRRRQFDPELDDEVRFHLETRAEELRSQGLTAKEAMDRARREFGPRARMEEQSRAAWQFQWMEDFWRDLVYGARAFAKSPGFTISAILSLGIGVGANCVMFSIVDGTLLRPPRVPQPDRIVGMVSTALDSSTAGISYPEFVAVRDRSQSFEALTGFTDATTGFAAHPGSPPKVKAGRAVTSGFFAVLRSHPELGRSFLAEEDSVPGKDSVVILSHACWQDEYGSDPSVLGKPARINGADFTVVGVMAARFTDVDDDLMDDSPCFYIPLKAAARLVAAPDLLENRTQRSLIVYGRLKPGVPLARAQAEAATIAAEIEKDHPDTNRNRTMVVRSMLQFRAGGNSAITVTSIAMAMPAVVLLIACLNVAGLLTSRAPARAREIAMRLAIGAGRARLVRQLLTESFLLAMGGAAVGVAIAQIPLALAKSVVSEFEELSTQPFPLVLDQRVLLFSVAVALASVILFGLLPTFRATRADLNTVMKNGGGYSPRHSMLARWFRGRNLLVAGQVAISLLLLTTTGVLYAGVYKSFVNSFKNSGFQVDHLLAISFDSPKIHSRDARAAHFFNDLAERLNRTQGVRAAAVDYQDIATIRPDSGVVKDDVKVSGVWVTERFFEALGIPILEGRAFQGADMGGAPMVAVVNEALAKRYWPGENVVGKQIRLSTGGWVNVIGVAKINAFMAFGTPPLDTIFLPYGVPQQRDIRLLVKSAGTPETLVEPVRAIMHDLDPDQVMPEAMPLQATFGLFIRSALLGLNTVASMGVLGLVLALVGLYGLLSYEVNSRTREIGIRMALGARAGAVVRMVMQHGVALAVCGIAVGIALNWGLEHALMAILGVGARNNGGNANPPPPAPNDGSQINFNAGWGSESYKAFTILVMAVFVVTIIAAWIPARRAARVDPNVALRAELHRLLSQSCRSAIAGSTFIARRAGIPQASSATKARITGADAIVAGS